MEFEVNAARPPNEAAANIALVALHGALADVLPLNWEGPYAFSGAPRPFLTFADAATHLATLTDKPARLEARWLMSELRIETTSLKIRSDAAAFLADWTSFQRESAEGFVSRLLFSDQNTVPISGGNARTNSTAAALVEFFLSFDISNGYVLSFDQKVDDAPFELRRYRGLRFGPNRRQSTIWLVDLV